VRVQHESKSGHAPVSHRCPLMIQSEPSSCPLSSNLMPMAMRASRGLIGRHAFQELVNFRGNRGKPD
jgi:hypothetical protein